MGNFFDFPRIGNELSEMRGVCYVLIFSEHRRNDLLEQYDLRVGKQKRLQQKKRNQTGRKIAFGLLRYIFPKMHPINWPNVYGRFGLRNVRRRSKIVGKYLPMRLETSGRNSNFGSNRMGNLVSDSKADVAGRLFAWSFRLSVAAGLRWDDLLNTAPTLVLLKNGPIGFAPKTKNRGNTKEDVGVQVFCIF